MDKFKKLEKAVLLSAINRQKRLAAKAAEKANIEAVTEDLKKREADLAARKAVVARRVAAVKRVDMEVQTEEVADDTVAAREVALGEWEAAVANIEQAMNHFKLHQD